MVHGTAWAATRTLQEAIAARGLTEWLRAWHEGFGLPVERKVLRWSPFRTIHTWWTGVVVDASPCRNPTPQVRCITGSTTAKLGAAVGSRTSSSSVRAAIAEP